MTHADPRCIASCRSVVVAIAELLNEAQRQANLHPAKSDDVMLEVCITRIRKKEEKIDYAIGNHG